MKSNIILLILICIRLQSAYTQIDNQHITVNQNAEFEFEKAQAHLPEIKYTTPSDAIIENTEVNWILDKNKFPSPDVFLRPQRYNQQKDKQRSSYIGLRLGTPNYIQGMASINLYEENHYRFGIEGEYLSRKNKDLHRNKDWKITPIVDYYFKKNEIYSAQLSYGREHRNFYGYKANDYFPNIRDTTKFDRIVETLDASFGYKKFDEKDGKYNFEILGGYKNFVVNQDDYIGWNTQDIAYEGKYDEKDFYAKLLASYKLAPAMVAQIQGKVNYITLGLFDYSNSLVYNLQPQLSFFKPKLQLDLGVILRNKAIRENKLKLFPKIRANLKINDNLRVVAQTYSTAYLNGLNHNYNENNWFHLAAVEKIYGSEDQISAQIKWNKHNIVASLEGKYSTIKNALEYINYTDIYYKSSFFGKNIDINVFSFSPRLQYNVRDLEFALTAEFQSWDRPNGEKTWYNHSKLKGDLNITHHTIFEKWLNSVQISYAKPFLYLQYDRQGNTLNGKSNTQLSVNLKSKYVLTRNFETQLQVTNLLNKQNHLFDEYKSYGRTFTGSLFYVF